MTKFPLPSLELLSQPVSGTDTVGIENPDEHRENVTFRNLAASKDFQKPYAYLPVILGNNKEGDIIVADLTRMPHLLMAGAAGTDTTMLIHSMLVSLLYHKQPSDVQLLLVDSKRAELAVYADEPHLVHPVVTEMTEAKNALCWAVHEMERRYEALALLRVREIAVFNQKLASYNKKGVPPEYADLKPMPYLVIVISELSDLMREAVRDVEYNIVRLAQLAEVAGIHMVLATQKPHFDVVTGLIKDNISSRICFQVKSGHCSRTILDQMGAENLGQGEMLYKPSRGRLELLQCPVISNDDVLTVVEHWKSYLNPSYEVDFSNEFKDTATEDHSDKKYEILQDPLYPALKHIVQHDGRINIALTQHYLRIGFERAVRLIEKLERDGLIEQRQSLSSTWRWRGYR